MSDDAIIIYDDESYGSDIRSHASTNKKYTYFSQKTTKQVNNCLNGDLSGVHHDNIKYTNGIITYKYMGILISINTREPNAIYYISTMLITSKK